MEEKNTLGSSISKKLDDVMARLNKVVNLSFDPKAVVITLEDGMNLFVESEDGEFVGKSVFMADDEGNRTDEPAPDGNHRLDDGREITVESGVITAVTEDETADNEIVEDLKQKVESLETELAKANADNKEALKMVDNVKEAHKELVSEIKNLKKMTVGNTTPVKKAIVEPQDKFNAPKSKGHKLDGFGGTLKNQLHIN